MRTDGLFVPDGSNGRTAVCSLMLDDSGDLITGVADMDIVKTALSPVASFGGLAGLLEKERPDIVVLDGNIGSLQAGELLAACEAYNQQSSGKDRNRILTLFEPTSVTKSIVALSHFINPQGTKRAAISFATPNVVELEQLYRTSVELGLLSSSHSESSDPVPGVSTTVLDPSVLAKARALVDANIFSTLLLKIGRHGVVIVEASRIQHQPIPIGEVQVVNTTGCGDSFAGAFAATLSHLLAQSTNGRVKNDDAEWHRILETAVDVGQQAARRTLASTRAVGDGMQLLLPSRS